MLSAKQIEIVRTIAFQEHRRVAINCYTRYGKTQCVAVAVCLYLMFNKNKRIALIAPQEAQTRILRDYISILITKCHYLSQIVDIDKGSGSDKLKKEASRQRLTFKNGCELRTLSAHGEANRLMGFGADIVIKDESCLIGDEANTRIMRMLGDDPEKAILIEISNPWTRDNKYYEHYSSGEYHTIHVGYKDGIKEGRTTQTFIDEMRSEYMDTPLIFKVMWDSEFPDESEDSLFSFAEIKAAVDKFKEINQGQGTLGADIADKGNDRTVMMIGKQRDGYYLVNDIFSEAKSENTAIAGRILNYRAELNLEYINVDNIGVGVGVLSMLKEQGQYLPVEIKGCHFGEGARNKKRFMNKKAEQYFRLKRLFSEGMISIPNHKGLIRDLLAMKWEHSSGMKVRIVDPSDRSPDFADALVYFSWGDDTKMTYSAR